MHAASLASISISLASLGLLLSPVGAVRIYRSAFPLRVIWANHRLGTIPRGASVVTKLMTIGFYSMRGTDKGCSAMRARDLDALVLGTFLSAGVVTTLPFVMAFPIAKEMLDALRPAFFSGQKLSAVCTRRSKPGITDLLSFWRGHKKPPIGQLVRLSRARHCRQEAKRLYQTYDQLTNSSTPSTA